MRKPFKIGHVQLDNPFLLAPLAGITDRSMRSLCSLAGASLTYTEMVSGKGLWYGDRKTDKLLEIGRNERRTAFQIFGSEPGIMEAAAEKLSARDNVLLDLNAGCPVPKIVRNGEGSALIKDHQLLYDVIRAMVKGSEAGAAGGRAKPVTVKFRMGFERDSDNAVETARAAEAAGASAVTVHGRTREQYYEGRADRDVIRRVKKAVSIPVIGNGDIYTGADALAMMDETGCDAVMIARGALGNPWIFRDAVSLWEDGVQPDPPSAAERIEMFILHMEMTAEDKGERKAVREMRKHVGWYVKGMRGAAAVRRAVNGMESMEEVRDAVRTLADEEGK